jgi:hypothetical protein
MQMLALTRSSLLAAVFCLAFSLTASPPAVRARDGDKAIELDP